MHHPFASLIPFLCATMSGKFAHTAMQGMLRVIDTQLRNASAMI